MVFIEVWQGLTLKMTKLKFELVSSRLDVVYQAVDLHTPKAYLDRDDCTSVARLIQMAHN